MIQENIFYSVDLFREVSSLEVDQDESKELFAPISCSSGSSGHLAIAHGSCLTLLSPGEEGALAVQAELEFDRPLEVLCWAPGGAGLAIAGDDDGTLHFVTASGLLVFSKRVIQGEFSLSPGRRGMPALMTNASVVCLLSLHRPV